MLRAQQFFLFPKTGNLVFSIDNEKLIKKIKESYS